jgi:hypothetical protein
MNKKEIFICQLAFGGYPVKPEDQKRAMGGALYLAKEKEFESGIYQDLWEYEIKKSKEKKKHLSWLPSIKMNGNKNFNR